MPDLSPLRAGLDHEPPDARVPRLELADRLDSEDLTDPRGAVLRAACAIHERIGGVAFPDRFATFWAESPGWEVVGRRLESLAQRPKDTAAFRQRYEQLVRGNVPLDPEDLGPTLRLQYDLQVRLLTSLGLLDDTGGITAVDGKRYPLPSYQDVLVRLQAPDLQRKLAQGFDTLLLVPFGLPLDRVFDAWEDALRRNAVTLRRVGEFESNDLLIWWDCRSEPVIYGPRSFTARHGGRTKEQLLASEHGGWDILLVEGSIAGLTRAEQGRAAGGRGRSPARYLRDLPDDEVGLTPEGYVVLFCDTLERRGQLVDQLTGTYLLGTYLPALHRVPMASWFPAFGFAQVSGASPTSYRYSFNGARTAVRVA